MQGLADGYFIIPATVSDYLARAGKGEGGEDHPAVQEAQEAVAARVARLLGVNGDTSVDEFHRRLGRLMWDHVGMARRQDGLNKVLGEIPELRERFWKEVRVPGDSGNLNQELEKAGRVADFLEFGELLARDALERDESCGAHYRVEHTTPEGEAMRRDDLYSYVAVWEHRGRGAPPRLHKEQLSFEYVTPSQRSYK
jgi:succinate dehydrogenase / fumarate reductase flavoprotein subunit